MEKAVVMIDAGFLSKVSYHLGEKHYFKYDLIKFAKQVAGKQNLVFKHLFFYTAPPFQSSYITPDEKKRKIEYDRFVQRLKPYPEEVTIREGRCQRLKIDGKFVYKQKGVDTLLTMDLMNLPIEHSKIKEVILIATDSDFVPVIQRLRELGIMVTLYTYFERDRKSIFSTSNKLLGSVSKYVKLTKNDFEGCNIYDSF